MNRVSIAIALLLTASACANRDNYVLLPDRGGQSGTLSVKAKEGGHQIKLEQPYQTARSTSGGYEQGSTNAQDVQRRYGAALDASPPEPSRFVLYFLEGSDELTPASKRDLEAILAEIKARPVPDIVVVGHTDRVGSVADNDRLALRRAESFRKRLVQQGIADDTIQTAGRGEREPLVNTADEVAEPRNRRIEILVR
ncbi:MAG TPA: OmpA family protein [Accumulibacter sp.]|jgi:outer membrane protein OmpA-like peptidoglycan-associated protein|nr:OmpA family protein [Accumulibacter sp.]HQC79081.1 OmpA family protein [Accumulibacter sp.]